MPWPPAWMETPLRMWEVTGTALGGAVPSGCSCRMWGPLQFHPGPAPSTHVPPDRPWVLLSPSQNQRPGAAVTKAHRLGT